MIITTVYSMKVAHGMNLNCVNFGYRIARPHAHATSANICYIVSVCIDPFKLVSETYVINYFMYKLIIYC